jgi:hypothetical protein
MRALTAIEKSAREAHFAQYRDCWMCRFLERKQATRTTLHHIAGRGKRHECRENYSALCSTDRAAIQSRCEAELVCLVLKKIYDFPHYSPETICSLRGRADTCWTHNDVLRCHRVMDLMKEVS